MDDRAERQEIYAQEVIAAAEARGYAIGRKKAAKRLIISMLEHNLPLHLISKIADQSEESILAIAREQGLVLKSTGD